MDASFSDVLARVAEVFTRELANEPAAREWLEAKGVSDAALLDRFGVGWAGGTLGSMARGEVAGRLRTLGLIDSQGRDRFSGCMVVPVRNPQGNIVQMAAYASDGALSWLFPEETPAFWNAESLRGAAELLIVPDPLAGLIEIAGGHEEVLALAGPGKPLGQGAKDLLVAHAPRVELKGCEFLKAEIESLGIKVRGEHEAGHEAALEQDENGFAVQFPRRLRFVVQGVSQDSPRHLRASVRVLRQVVEGASTPSRSHLDTLDLYHARSRTGFAKTAACLLGEDPIIMEEHLSRVVTLAEEFLRKRVEAPPAVVLSDDDREEALALLRNPRYPECVAEDLTQMGYVGEEPNKQVAYLASLSRKLEEPLSILVVSRSAAGKSTLSEAIAGLAPAEDVLRFTRLTAQTLYYQKTDSLCHRMVVIEEEKGVEDAAYALRILQSAKRLSLSTAAGMGQARTREVKGPVSLFVTTTRTDLDEETAGRFLTLSVDESKEQTRAILAVQRESEARSPEERERLLRLHQNAQRLLAPVSVVNPYAPQLTFPDDRLSSRRDHRKYLGLIRAIAFSRQHQREIREGTVSVTLEDIALANRLAHHALGQSLYDLTPPSRRLLMELRDWLTTRADQEGVALNDLRFTRRELRHQTGWKRTQLEEHLKELLHAEYVLSLAGGGQGKRVTYRLDWDGQGLDGERFYSGLMDPAQLAGCLPEACRTPGGKRETAQKGRKRPMKGDSGRSCRVAGEEGS
jgi:energy-coupling factor transporter ATP-binding protein EcfA2